MLSPKHWRIRPFQNVTFCPGMAHCEESRDDQRRPKPQEPQGGDSDNEVDVTLSRHLRPTALLTVSLTRSPTVLVRRVFTGKRFSHWLDRQSELFLQGEYWTEVDDVGPPFINCIYIKLKPLDVVLCPQLVSYLKGALRELQDPEKIVTTDDRRFFNVEAPLPGHCMPLLFMALDELRLFVPSPGVNEFSMFLYHLLERTLLHLCFIFSSFLRRMELSVLVIPWPLLCELFKFILFQQTASPLDRKPHLAPP